MTVQIHRDVITWTCYMVDQQKALLNVNYLCLKLHIFCKDQRKTKLLVVCEYYSLGSTQYQTNECISKN